MKKKLLKDFNEGIEKSGVQIEDDEWSPSLCGIDSSEDDNSRFIIDGKKVQGVVADGEVLEFMKSKFFKTYH